jgi:hypothetical protein
VSVTVPAEVGVVDVVGARSVLVTQAARELLERRAGGAREEVST